MTPEAFYVGQKLDNGATVIACRQQDTDSWVILALVPNASSAAHPYAIWNGFPNGTTSWGDYHDNIIEATDAYDRR
jgi:hypothetical protein